MAAVLLSAAVQAQYNPSNPPEPNTPVTKYRVTGVFGSDRKSVV